MKALMEALTAAIVSNQITVETARAMLLSAKNGQNLPLTVGDPIEPPVLHLTEADVEKAVKTYGSVSEAAAHLGVSRATVYRKLSLNAKAGA